MHRRNAVRNLRRISRIYVVDEWQEMTNQEDQYSRSAGRAKLKKFGQYFTPPPVAQFMTRWVLADGAKTLLDPAVGNAVFFRHAAAVHNTLRMTGFELDPEIIRFFDSDQHGEVILQDFLLSPWDTTYDAIIGNPPYNRFQAIDNRSAIREAFFNATQKKISGYTNQYALFLLKSMHQLSATGRLAFLIPSEFLDSTSGAAVKDFMVQHHLLRAIIHFDTSVSLFQGVTTTSCIVLLDREPKNSATFFQLTSPSQLDYLDMLDSAMTKSHEIPYALLVSQPRWRSLIANEEIVTHDSLVEFSRFAKATRGIATGDNAFFLLNKAQVDDLHLTRNDYESVVGRSADVTTAVFTKADYTRLVKAHKKGFLFNPRSPLSPSPQATRYIEHGLSLGVDQKYLCAHRTPWYRQENKPVAPIWLSPASRTRLKVVRNQALVKHTTTFHGILPHKEYEGLTNILFCYLLTPTAQSIIMRNKKEMATGLMKFQPNDINKAQVLDLTLISTDDRKAIEKLYCNLSDTNFDETVALLERYFLKYIITAT